MSNDNYNDEFESMNIHRFVEAGTSLSDIITDLHLSVFKQYFGRELTIEDFETIRITGIEEKEDKTKYNLVIAGTNIGQIIYGYAPFIGGKMDGIQSSEDLLNMSIMEFSNRIQNSFDIPIFKVSFVSSGCLN